MYCTNTMTTHIYISSILCLAILVCFSDPAYAEVECYTDIGIAVHSNSFDNDTNKKETNSSIIMDNPIGIVNYECSSNGSNIVYFINHDSSILDTHDKGLTKLGVKYRFK